MPDAPPPSPELPARPEPPVRPEPLVLLPPSLGLVPAFHEALVESLGALRPFFAWAAPTPTLDDTRATMERAVADFAAREGELRFVVARASDRRVLGCIGLSLRKPSIPWVEIGYWVRASEAGRGVATAAVALAEAYAVRHLGVRRLEIRMAGTNAASRRVAEKAGFAYEGTLRHARRLPSGALDDTRVYAKVFGA